MTELTREQVKGLLVWRECHVITTDDDNGPREGIPRRLKAWRADQYEIVQQDSPNGRFILSGMSDGCGLVLPYLAEAKAAAENDRAALSNTP